MKKIKAFTLAELMIVVLIVTILLAAFAPIITKRQMQASRNKNNVWNWVTSSANMDAYYIADSKYGTGISYFQPQGTKEELLGIRPYGKLVVQSSGLAPQISLYTNKTNFKAKWLMDRSNAMLGSTYANMKNSAKSNVALGNNALNTITTGSNNVALGYNAISNISSYSNNVSIGASSGGYGTDNVYIGAEAGSTANSSRNTFIGYAGKYPKGGDNTCVGYESCSTSNTGFSFNTAIGAYTLKNASSSANSNVAIGYGALQNLTSGSYNTAIGYNACSELTQGSYVTCIGANSGPHSGTSAAGESGLREFNASHYRTYIGGKPKFFGGDAVLEIHNIDTTNGNLINKPTTLTGNTTTVINGNLMVRGKIYFTFGDYLYAPTLTTHGMYRYITANRYGNGTPYTACANANLRDIHGRYTFSYTTSGCSGLPQFSSSSDRRLKNNIATNNDGIDKLMNLNVYEYNFKNDKSKQPHVGVIAQELQKVFPNSVTQDKDGYLKIRWDEMFFALVNSIKDINRKIVQALKDVTTLDAKISKLEKENLELKQKTQSLNLRLQKLKKSNIK